MGKVRRKREKLHFSVKSNPTISESIPQETANCNFVVEPSENLFAGLDIPMDKLANFSDARSTTSTASTKRREEKRRIRLETFIHKINQIQQFKSSKHKKILKTSAATTQKHEVEDLPLFKLTGDKRIKPMPKKRSIPKMKQRKKEMLKNVKAFQSIMQNPSFKADPVTAVTELIQKKILDSEG